jgi:hypothetical protein
MLIGNVKKIMTGFITIFTKAITTAAKSAALKPAMLIPGTSHAMKIKDSAYKTHLNINSMFDFPYLYLRRL